MGNKGITLVSLVITIIVMLILAGVSLSMLVGDGSVLDQAKNASTATVLGSIKEEFELNKTGRKMKEVVNANGKINKSEDTGIYAMGTEVLQYIPNMDKGYIGKVGIFNDELVFVGEELSEEDKGAAQGLGYTLMNQGDYLYMSLMKKMETLVKGKDTSKGNALSASNFHEIAGIKYGTSWYEITESQLTGIGFNGEEVNVMKEYAPFVVRFNSGEVLSTRGRTMYEDEPDKKIHKYTFNYAGEKDGVVITDLMAGVDKTSEKDGDKYGAFSSENGNFVIDSSDNNALVLGGADKAIGELPIDQNVFINKEYSVNITVKCNVYQTGETSGSPSAFPSGVTAKHHKSMIAVSDESDKYVCWLGVDGGVLRLYTFRYIFTAAHSWANEPNGYFFIDVKEYDQKIMNIQVTSVRGGETSIYINGELKARGPSGNSEFTYKTLTIGDLRKNRNLRYEGRMYNVSLYGRALTEAEVQQNYQAIKKELGF